jgi:hypothetical protein
MKKFIQQLSASTLLLPRSQKKIIRGGLSSIPGCTVTKPSGAKDCSATCGEGYDGWCSPVGASAEECYCCAKADQVPKQFGKYDPVNCKKTN